MWVQLTAVCALFQCLDLVKGDLTNIQTVPNCSSLIQHYYTSCKNVANLASTYDTVCNFYDRNPWLVPDASNLRSRDQVVEYYTKFNKYNEYQLQCRPFCTVCNISTMILPTTTTEATTTTTESTTTITTEPTTTTTTEATTTTTTEPTTTSTTETTTTTEPTTTTATTTTTTEPTTTSTTETTTTTEPTTTTATTTTTTEPTTTSTTETTTTTEPTTTTATTTATTEPTTTSTTEATTVTTTEPTTITSTEASTTTTTTEPTTTSTTETTTTTEPTTTTTTDTTTETTTEPTTTTSTETTTTSTTEATTSTTTEASTTSTTEASTTTATDKTTTTTPQPAPTPTPMKCAYSNITDVVQAKISNGNPTRQCDYPWVVAVKTNPTGGATTALPPLCAGVFKDATTVIVSETCTNTLVFFNNTLECVAGEYFYSVDEPDDEAVRCSITKVNTTSGLAELTLERQPSSWETKCVAPACIQNDRTNPDYDTCRMVGWGVSPQNSNLPPQILQYAQIPGVDDCERLAAYVNIRDSGTFNSTTGLMCSDFATASSAACNGDQGGALMCRDTETAEWITVGVIDRGNCQTITWFREIPPQ